MRKETICKGLLTGGMILMMTATAFAQEIYLDAEGNETTKEEAAVIEQEEVDEAGQVVAVSFTDPDGNSVIFPAAGFAKAAYTYDENGWINSECYFGTDGERIALENGVSGILTVNGDNQKYPLEQVYLDVDDKPVINKDLGYARVTRGLDEEGRIVLVSFFDADGSLVVTPSGYAIVAREYNDKNEKIKEAYFDAEENPIALPGKDYAGYAVEFDENGEKTATLYFAPDGTQLD